MVKISNLKLFQNKEEKINFKSRQGFWYYIYDTCPVLELSSAEDEETISSYVLGFVSEQRNAFLFFLNI